MKERDSSPNKHFERRLRLSLAAYRSASETYDSAFKKFAEGDKQGFRDEAKAARMLSQMAQNIDPMLNGFDSTGFKPPVEGEGTG